MKVEKMLAISTSTYEPLSNINTIYITLYHYIKQLPIIFYKISRKIQFILT